MVVRECRLCWYCTSFHGFICPSSVFVVLRVNVHRKRDEYGHINKKMDIFDRELAL